MCDWCDYQELCEFQSTRPRGARLSAGEYPAHGPTCFNPRAREGRDVSPPHSGAGVVLFQSTRPRGARRQWKVDEMESLVFQSTRPRGARRKFLMTSKVIVRFQSTRPRGARQTLGYQVIYISKVSIHAPARGATQTPKGYDTYEIVSIHAPARGATDFVVPLPLSYAVSIHAPARGATTTLRPLSPRGGCFNPRAREGRDTTRNTYILKVIQFQSTRPRGARLLPRSRFVSCLTFQSTRPRGARRKCLPMLIFDALFQSTRPRGARPATLARLDRSRPFQSTRPRGARLGPAGTGKSRICVSIHAPARGATSPRAHGFCKRTCFNPRAREGRDLRGYG